MVLRRPFVVLSLFAAAFGTACDNGDSTTLPNVDRGIVTVTVDPKPVVATQNQVSFESTASYTVVVSEINGLGGEVLFVNASVFDTDTGVELSANYYDSADLVVFVGKKRVEPLGSLRVPQSLTYRLPPLADGTLNAGKAATLTVTVQFRDDRGHVTNASVLVKIQ